MTLNLGVVLVRQLLLRFDHTHADILLMSGSDLLLLLVQHLDLLGKGELIRC